MFLKRLAVAVCLLLPMISCGCAKSAAQPSCQFPDGLVPFPEVPASVTEPADRACYVMENFWNPVDFTDETLLADSSFWEQNFVNFAQFYPFVADSARTELTRRFLDRVAASPQLLDRIAQLSGKYLYQRDSELYNETAYIDYLRYFLDSKAFDDAQRQKFSYLLEQAMKNRPGMLAADFAFTTREGRRSTLRSCSTRPYLLLVFYNSECENCHELIGRAMADPQVRGLLQRGVADVLAVDAEGDREAWKSDAGNLPKEWIVAFDEDGILDRDIYVYDTPPSLYLLDGQRRVVLKDATLEQLVDYAQSH